SAVELVLIALFLRQHLVAPGLERAKAAVDLPDLAAIEPGSGARQVREETAVVADDDKRAAAVVEFALQPFDGGEIEMVGRLLRQIADGGAGLHKTAAMIGFDQAGRDLQQRRFAGAVAADQTDALG